MTKYDKANYSLVRQKSQSLAKEMHARHKPVKSDGINVWERSNASVVSNN